MRLLPVSEGGSVPGFSGPQTAELSGILQHTVDFYSQIGFEEPWISYLAIDGAEPVGICSFKSRPMNGRVEIAYFTFPTHEGRGIATEMASRLVALASSQPDVRCIAAQTLPERNASHRILEKLGFEATGTVEHPEDGAVVEWRLRCRAGA